MTVDRWNRVQELFEQALKLPQEERAAFLSEACDDDAELKADVELLLERDEQPGGDFMRRSELSQTRVRDDSGTRLAGEASPDRRNTSDSPDQLDSKKIPAGPPSIDGYEIIREVGRGGMGIVYEARNTALDRVCAIKTIIGQQHSPKQLEMLRREAQLAAVLRHPNIVAIHDFAAKADPPCIIMEWIDGISLDQVAGQLDFDAKAKLCLKLARAVAYAHGKGVIHRDLKPGNVLVDRFGEPRILDFGLARLATRWDNVSSGKHIKGTPLYMAPEQFLRPAEVGSEADVYAIGLILFTLLTDTSPPRPESNQSWEEWAAREIPLPRELNANVPEALQRICLKACEFHEHDRYKSAGQLAADLERFLDRREVKARPKRYSTLLRERVSEHVESLTRWEADRLISQRETDSLQAKYFTLLRTESSWLPDARLLRPGTMLIQGGGWLVVLSAILWVAFYWNDLSSAERVLAIGFPTMLINVGAYTLWRRRSRLVALIFTVVGALLLPLFALVVLSEAGILTGRRPDYELLPSELFTNRQLAAVFWGMAFYAAALAWHKRYASLATVFVFMLTLAFTATLLLLGLMEWLMEERFATVGAVFLPLVVIAYVMARLLDSPRCEQLAVPFYTLAALGFAATTATLAYDAPRSWLDLEEPNASGEVNALFVTRELFFVTCSAIYFLLAFRHDQSVTRLRRLWGRLYFRIVPPCCVIPLDLLGDEPMWSLGEIGAKELYAPELLVPMICVLLIAGGTRLQLRWFMYYGLLHLAIFLVWMTGNHFQDYLSWPAIIVGFGALAMAAGLILEYRRLSQQTDKELSDQRKSSVVSSN